MRDLLLPIVVFFPLYIGVGVVALLFLKRFYAVALKVHVTLLAESFLIGAGVTTYLEFVLSEMGIPFRTSLIALSVISLIGWRFIVQHRERKLLKISYTSVLFWLVPVLLLFFFFTRSVSRVMYTWDAIAFWIPKMTILFQDQRVNLDGLIKFNHPEYPLLLPLIGANSFTLMGEPNQIAAKTVIFGFTISFIVVVGNFLLSRLSKPKALFWLVLLMSLFIFREHVAGEYVGTADVFVAIYFAVGSIALLKKQPALALVFWLLSSWSKSEGLVFVLVTTFLLFIFYKQLRLLIIGALAFFLAPWQLLLRLQKVDTSQYFKFDEIYIRPWGEYVVYSVHAFREEFRNLQKWNLLFFFFLSATLTHVRRILSNRPLLIIMAGLTAQLAMYMVIFTITPEEQATFIAAAVSRLTLHLTPTALIVTATLLSKDLHETDS